MSIVTNSFEPVTLFANERPCHVTKSTGIPPQSSSVQNRASTTKGRFRKICFGRSKPTYANNPMPAPEGEVPVRQRDYKYTLEIKARHAAAVERNPNPKKVLRERLASHPLEQKRMPPGAVERKRYSRAEKEICALPEDLFRPLDHLSAIFSSKTDTTTEITASDLDSTVGFSAGHGLAASPGSVGKLTSLLQDLDAADE